MKKTTGEILEELISTNHDVLKQMKTLMMDNCKYEAAASIRDVEKKKFPKIKLKDSERERVMNFDVLLRLVNFNVGMKNAYIILKSAELFAKVGGDGNIGDATKITAKAEEIFGK